MLPLKRHMALTVLHLLMLFGPARGRLLGRTCLGSYMFARGSALEHWNEMMTSTTTAETTATTAATAAATASPRIKIKRTLAQRRLQARWHILK